jgi:hypothetical protein
MYLGASTDEAQVNVARDIAVQMCDVFDAKDYVGIASIFCRFIFFTYASTICRFIAFTHAILAGLHYLCIRTIDFVTPFIVIYLNKHHHHYVGIVNVSYMAASSLPHVKPFKALAEIIGSIQSQLSDSPIRKVMMT